MTKKKRSYDLDKNKRARAEEKKKMMQDDRFWGGWNPNEIECVESGVKFQFMNLYRTSRFLNVPPDYLGRKLMEASFVVQGFTFIQKNGVNSFKISKLW